MNSDFYILGATLLYVTASFSVPIYLKAKNKISGYQARKAIHALTGLSVLCLPYLKNPELAVAASGVFTASMLMARKNSHFRFLAYFYNQIKEAEENALGYLQGPFAYAAAVTFTALLATLYPLQTPFFIAALFCMIFADTAASIVGKRYGKHKISLFSRKDRSVEGSLAFFVIALLCSALIYTFLPTYYAGSLIILSLITAVIATLLELISPSKWDDLVIPIGTSALLLLLV